MLLLVVGVVLFLLPHSVRIVAEGGRARLIERFGRGPYMLAYSALSLVGLILIGQGFEAARAAGPQVWLPPEGTRHLSLLLVPLALVAVAAAYAPAGRIKRTLRHPMIFGVGLWALAHLLANGGAADIVLFGAFLAWAVLDYLAAVRRDPQPVPSGAVSATGDAVAVVAGLAVAAVLLGGAHVWLFGVSPIG